MDTFLWLIRDHGYAIVFLWTLLEGETIVAVAGFAAYLGYLKLSILFPVALVGTIIGDGMYYAFGRWKGRQFLAARPKLAARAEDIQALLDRYHGWIIFGSRFLYGFRTILPIAIGASRIPAHRYFFFNILGAVVWTVLFIFGGYVFGGALETLLGNVKMIEAYLIVSIVALVALAQLAMWAGRRSNRKRAARLPRQTPPEGRRE